MNHDPRPSTVAAYACDRCGEPHGVQAPRCRACGSWRTVQRLGAADERPRDPTRARPIAAPTPPARRAGGGRPEAVPITQVERQPAPKIETGEPQFDRVLGGGIPRGAVLLFSGPPGAGKSTILLALCGDLAEHGHRVLYATAEELSENVAERAERLEKEHDDLLLIATKQISDVEAAVRQHRPDLLVVDSISKVAATRDGKPGSPSEMNEVSEAIERMAIAPPAPGTQGRLAVLVVIHVNKAKEIAGAMSVQHLFGGTFFLQRVAGGMRSLTGRKNRFGIDTTGYFDMTKSGLRSIADPSRRFLADRAAGLPGSVVAPVIVEGDEDGRASLVEVQARVGSVATNARGMPAGEVLITGVHAKRLSQRLAVVDEALTNYCGAAALLDCRTVSVNVPGGLDATETAMDLPIALAIASSALGAAVPEDAVAFGEIGLVGEVRGAVSTEQRLGEAAAMRFQRSIAPRRAAAEAPEGMEVLEAATLVEALALAFPDHEGCAEGLAYLGSTERDDDPDASGEAPPPARRSQGAKRAAPAKRATSKGGTAPRARRPARLKKGR